MVGPLYSSEILDRRAGLPRKPDGATLIGDRFALRPFDRRRDAAPLHDISSGPDADALVWRYMHAGPFVDADALGAWLAEVAELPDARAFTVVARDTERPVGFACYHANQPAHLKIELGTIWYGVTAQRTGANREAARLMIEHAISLGYQRIEWKCDVLNERSKHAALRLGFTFEGVQDAHYIVKGRRRDTAWYRILAHEWPAIRAASEIRTGTSGTVPYSRT